MSDQEVRPEEIVHNARSGLRWGREDQPILSAELDVNSFWIVGGGSYFFDNLTQRLCVRTHISSRLPVTNLSDGASELLLSEYLAIDGRITRLD
jgi:hypothetical protein